MRGVDYSDGRPGGAALAAEGWRFAIRYLPYPTQDPFGKAKALTVEEIADLRAHGIGLGVVFEINEQRPLGGFAQGQKDAQLVEAAHAQLGLPEWLPTFMGADFDVRPNQYTVCGEYILGAADVLTYQRTGCYGPSRFLQHLADIGACAWFWQALGWSYSYHFPGRDLWQYQNAVNVNGAPVDYDESYSTGCLWLPEEEDMTPDEVRAIVREEIATLNEAIVKRLDIEELANGPYEAVKAAHEQLKTAGLLRVGDS